MTNAKGWEDVELENYFIVRKNEQYTLIHLIYILIGLGVRACSDLIAFKIIAWFTT